MQTVTISLKCFSALLFCSTIGLLLLSWAIAAELGYFTPMMFGFVGG